MDDGGPSASIICFVVLLLIDMFFYGFGAAVASLNEKEIERRAEEEKDRLDAYADYHFTCGILYMKAVQSDTAKYIAYLPSPFSVQYHCSGLDFQNS